MGVPPRRSCRKERGQQGRDKEGGTAVSGKALDSIRGITIVILGVPAIDSEADIPIGRTMVAPTILMDVRVMKMTLMVASPIVPTIAEEEEM